VGLAFAALRFAITTGIALNALVALTVRTLQANGPRPTAVDLGSAPAVILLGGTFVACLVAAVATWRIMARARSPYRQGMLAMVSFFASFVGSMIAWPIDGAFGRAGLAALTLGTAGLGVLAWRSVRRELTPR
jgi:hypothetical protein